MAEYNDAFIKTAQYLAGLTVNQDIWSETGKVLVNFFGADLGAIAKGCQEDGMIRHYWLFSEHFSGRKELEDETGEAIAEVLESGFLTLRVMFVPEPLTLVFLPVTQENRVMAVMLAGHGTSEALPKMLLNAYLAVAGLVGTTFTRLTSEQELRMHRHHLEQVVQQRTAELTAANEQLQREIIERARVQEQLLHAQKLESLGVLAGGIAHDFNNILMAIIGNADLALMRISRESPAIENLRSIEKAATRAADLAKQMLAYSGKGRFVIEDINVNRLLEEMLTMLEVSISKKAVLRLNFAKNLPLIEADATQLRQIVMNLVINASEAIGERSGVISVTSGCMECDRSYLKNVWWDENIAEGRYVFLEIADSGCGMGKETLSKLFDPFFTTKFTGRGLGMAAVLGIVRGHKGTIKVYSEPGKGTSFKILLPASENPAELLSSEAAVTLWHGTGNVLLVDDEESVRGIGVAMLSELGYTVITANDGQEAIEIFKQTPDIAFVILDLTMPHLDGEQCFRELRRLKADVKVIMSSGYNEQEVTQKFTGKGLAGFIQKPYRFAVLSEAIKSISAGSLSV
jgi:signal transduction histidine kinase